MPGLERMFSKVFSLTQFGRPGMNEFHGTAAICEPDLTLDDAFGRQALSSINQLTNTHGLSVPVSAWYNISF